MISIIVPVYRVEKYISGCIKSIIEQTEKNFELIVVDDGSPDRSSEIAEKILSDSWLTNYHVIHTENRGVSAARNTGIKAARGEFVIMVDADDVLAPCFLEDMVAMEMDNLDCDIYSSGFSVVDEDRASIFTSDKNEMELLTSEEAINVYQSRKIKFLLPTLMLRKKFLDRNNIVFDEKVRYSEDVQFIWRCLFYNTKTVVHCRKENYNYILHENSTMTSSGIVKILTGFEGLDVLSKEVSGKVEDNLLVNIKCQMYFSLLHGASRMLNFCDFKTLFNETGCRKKLQKRKDGDYRYRLVSTILKINLKAGYSIMRKF